MTYSPIAADHGSHRQAFYAIGPSSTGKTTLCNALVKRLGIPDPFYIREVARDVMKTQGYSRDDIWSLDMQLDIMKAHFSKENTLDNAEEVLEFRKSEEEHPHSRPIRICDRSALDPIVYAMLTATSQEEAIRRKEFLISSAGPDFIKALTRYRDKGSVVLLFKPVRAWVVDDGVRSLEDQDKSLEAFRRVLKEVGVAYYEVGEEMSFLEERVNWVMGLVTQ